MRIDDVLLDDQDAGLFRVHRSTMTSEEIAQVEWERVFERTWLFVGHDSEIPQPGDFKRREVARRPLIFVRGEDGAVRILLNSCSHRGAEVCRQDAGNARTFQCFYHAWTFNTTGDLVGVPGKDAYSQEFVGAPDLALTAPPRTAEYRGLHFVSFSADAEDFETFIGGVRRYLDLTLDSAEVLGGWEVLQGTAQWDIKANWKLLVENSIDCYHFATVHKTYEAYKAARRAARGIKSGKASLGPGTLGVTSDAGHGGFIHRAEGRPIASSSTMWPDELNAETARVRALLDARFPAEDAAEMAEKSRHLLIFPNLMFQDSATGFRLRQIWPMAAGHMRVVQWELAPREEEPALRRGRLDNSGTFLGPGGFGTPDDVEALESCQIGFGAREAAWNDISRGIKRDTPQADDELQQRGFWRAWHRMMRDGSSVVAAAGAAQEVAR
jgi:p-cumate 2,3-dioxygenase alpha subunit